MTPEQSDLVDRLRVLLADEPMLREVSMFGGRSFMVNEKMIVSALKDGRLLVRVDPVRHERFLGRGGAAQATMGTDRDMGPGWIEVAAAQLSDDDGLSSWVGIALEYNRSFTGTSR